MEESTQELTIKRHTQTQTIVLDNDECRHHWVIESPHGPISKGICRICGDEKGFRNSLDTPTEDENNKTKTSNSENNPKITASPSKN